MKANQNAFDAGQLVEKLTGGYFSHLAATKIASDPRSSLLMPPILPNQIVPIGEVEKKEGTKHTFDFAHYLQLATKDELISTVIDQIWFYGAIIIIGDLLAKNNYFDKAPELELIRHLRNGIAHGNRFKIDEPYKLQKYPAHNKLAMIKGTTIFEITPSLQNSTVLFDFMAAGDLLDLFQSIGLYLIRMGNGDPLRV